MSEQRPSGPESARGAADRGWAEIARLHLWQIQPVRDVLLIVAALGLIHVGYLARVVTVPLLLGLLLAYLFEPIVRRLAKRTGRTLAALIVIVAAFVGIGGPVLVGAGFGVAQAVRFGSELRHDLPRIMDRAERTWMRAVVWAEHRLAPSHGVSAGAPTETQSSTPTAETPASDGPDPAATPTPAPRPLAAVVQEWLRENNRQVARVVAGGGAEAFSLGLRIITTSAFVAFNVFFLVPFFFFFCSMSLGGLQRMGMSLVPRGRRDGVRHVLHKMDLAISGFIRGRITICAILAVLFTIAYWIAGVPAPLILGPITGVLAIVPYLAMLSVPAAIALTWVEQANEAQPMALWLIIVGPIVAYWVVQLMDDYLLTPLIQGKSTGLDTPTILVAVLGAASIAGVYGVLVAIPAAACVRILITDVVWPRYRAWAEGSASDPLPLPEASRADAIP